jgi:methylated-DNA-[protein]-cysteine S-methyltransferase
MMETMTSTEYRVIDSPVGPLTIAGRGGVVTHLRMADQAHPPTGQDDWVAAPDGAFEEVVRQLDHYFAGELTTFDVAVDLAGTEFQQRVWKALQEIPYGETWSYGELARHIGQPGSSRAVGLANGRNPVAIIVPCHRVIGANGSMTGYGGGIERKVRLLELEQSRAEPRLPL